MKKRLLFPLAAALLVLLCGCGKEDEIPKPELVNERAYVLSDGTAVSMWRGLIDAEHYRLPDGTELLIHHPAVPIENVASVGRGVGGLNEKAQARVKEYFKQRGELYDVGIALESAYRDLLNARETGRKFESHPLMCEDVPVGENSHYLSVQTLITGVKTDSYYLGEASITLMSVIFDRESGEPVSVWSLFSVDEKQAKERLVSFFAEEYDKAVLLERFDMADISWRGDLIEVVFPAECIEGEEYDFGAGIDVADIADIMTDKALEGVEYK